MDCDEVSAGIDAFVISGNRLLREALANLLRKKLGIRGVLAAAFSHEVAKQVREAGSDIVLIDRSGTIRAIHEVVEQIKRELPELRVILIGMELDAGQFIRCVQAGISGYMLKDASGRDLAQAVLAVAGGSAVCPPHLCMELFRYFAQGKGPSADLTLHKRLRLSNRECQLMDQIRTGSTNKEIAQELNLSEQTVKNHVHRILRKLGAPDRMAASEMCYGE
jgi:DNA-binding NarL/FixJ family response regulator